MHTIQLQIQDDIYENLKDKGIDINHKIQDFLCSLVDDGYPAISKEEAKQRVSDAVDRYRNGTGIYLSADDYLEYKSNMIDSLKSKYANH